MRDPVKARILAYNWIKQNCNYQKIFEKYMLSGDYMLMPNDNKTRMSTFGLSQSEYIEGSNCKLFVFENFENVLDYIDCIFGKSIHRMDQINTSKNKLSIEDIHSDTVIQIKDIYSKDIFLYTSLKQINS